jgi:hypothetical protein
MLASLVSHPKKYRSMALLLSLKLAVAVVAFRSLSLSLVARTNIFSVLISLSVFFIAHKFVDSV